MSIRKARTIHRVYLSLAAKDGWGTGRAREQVCLDYGLSLDEFDVAIAMANAR